MKNLLPAFAALAKTLEPIGRPFQEAFEAIRKKQFREAKEFARHFKVEITKGFWGTKTKAIQRDEPLTEEQLAKIGFAPPPPR